MEERTMEKELRRRLALLAVAVLVAAVLVAYAAFAFWIVRLA